METTHHEENIMRKKVQTGFTLVELIMVITIISILAAVAVPAFINLQSNAQQASTDGMAGALGSASAVNYMARKTNGTLGVPVANCTDVSKALQGGTLPTGYTITAAAIAVDASVNCTVTGPGSKTHTFTGLGIS